jgi:hypothetical protein
MSCGCCVLNGLVQQTLACFDRVIGSAMCVCVPLSVRLLKHTCHWRVLDTASIAEKTAI